MIKISKYGFRDGIINARAAKLHQKRYKEDVMWRPYASTVPLASAVDLSSSTVTEAGITIGTQIDYPRNIKFMNGLIAASERALQLKVSGYDCQGAYQEEVFVLPTAAAGTVSGSKAFSYITTFKTHGGTGNYGTYGTVSIHPCHKFGISEYCDGAGDGLGVSLGTAAVKTLATTNLVAGKVSVANQTVDLTAKSGTTYERIGIRYLSKFQRRHGDAD